MRHAKTGRTKVKAREEKEIIKNTEKEEIDRFRNKAELIACTCRVVKIYRSCCLAAAMEKKLLQKSPVSRTRATRQRLKSNERRIEEEEEEEWIERIENWRIQAKQNRTARRRNRTDFDLEMADG